MTASKASRDKSADSDPGKTWSVSEREKCDNLWDPGGRGTLNPSVKGSHFGVTTLTKKCKKCQYHNGKYSNTWKGPALRFLIIKTRNIKSKII